VCPDEGMLQAYLDGELDIAMAAQVALHLAGCVACRKRLHGLEALAASTTAALAPYRQGTAAGERPVWVPPLSQLPYHQTLTKPRRLANMIQRRKWLAGAAASIVALAVFLSWAPGRGLAAQFLNIFRAERIQMVELTPEDMAQLDTLLSSQGGEVEIRNFGRVEFKPPAVSMVEAEPSQVEALSGLRLDLPATLAGRERVAILVEPLPTITFTLDVESLNAYLRRHSLALLPPALAGQSFTLNLPPLVRVQYGQTGQSFALYAAGDLTIDGPQGVDLAPLRQAMLRVPFLPDNLRRQLASIEDWRQTLPIPMTAQMAGREITVNGNPGFYFVVDAADDRGKVSLAWRQGDGWRAITGLTLEEALRVATRVR